MGRHRFETPSTNRSIGVWNIMSQLSQSGVSFLVILAFSHTFSARDFGLISAAAIILAILMSMNRSVLGEQLLAAKHSRDVVDGYWKFQKYSLFALTIAVISVSYLLVGLLGSLASYFFVMYAISDGIRYALFVGVGEVSAKNIALVDILRFLTALCGLAVALTAELGPVVVVLALLSSTPWIFYATFTYRGNSTSTGTYLASLGRYELMITLQYVFATAATQCLPIVSLSFAGPDTLGAIRLTQSLLNPVAVLALSCQPTLIKWMAHQPKPQVLRAVRRLVIAATAGSTLIVTIAIYAKSAVLTILVPADMASVVSAVWIPVVLSVIAVVVGQPGGALIRVLKLGGASLTGQVCGTATAYTALVVVMCWGQPAQISIAIAAGGIGSVVVTYLLLYLSIRRSNESGRVASPN